MNKLSKNGFILILIISGINLYSADLKVEPEQNAVITVWESPRAEAKFIKYAGREFEKKYSKYNVKVKHSGIDPLASVGKLQTSIRGGESADVYVFPHDKLGEAVNSGIIMPNLVSAEKIKKDFMPAAVNAATYKDKKLYGFPLSIETNALFYNKKLLDKAPDTFEYLLEKGKAFTDRKNNTCGLYFDISSLHGAYPFITMYGGYIFGNNGYNKDDIGLDNKGSVEGLKALLNLKPICPAILTARGQADPMISLFGEGKIMAIIAGPWEISRLRILNIDFGIVPLPTFNGKTLTTLSGVILMGVNPFSKCRKAAQLFAAFCTTPEMLLKRFEITSQVPPVKSLVDNPKLSGDSCAKPFIEQSIHSQPMPTIPEMKLIWDPVSVAIYDVWNSKATPGEALDKAVKVIKEQIKLRSN